MSILEKTTGLGLTQVKKFSKGDGFVRFGYYKKNNIYSIDYFKASDDLSSTQYDNEEDAQYAYNELRKPNITVAPLPQSSEANQINYAVGIYLWTAFCIVSSPVSGFFAIPLWMTGCIVIGITSWIIP